jgi:hypothetical protein
MVYGCYVARFCASVATVPASAVSCTKSAYLKCWLSEYRTMLYRTLVMHIEERRQTQA